VKRVALLRYHSCRRCTRVPTIFIFT